MAQITEPLSGGLVTSRDPGLLEPGQLSQMQNCYYRRGSQALQRAKGRQLFGSVTATAASIVGIRDIQFDNGQHDLLAMAIVTGTGRLRFFHLPDAIPGTAGATDVANVLGIPGVTNMDVVHYRNRFFVLNGAVTGDGEIGTNRVVYLSATATGQQPSGRQHGMAPVTATPEVTTAAGTFSLTVTGFYDYWATEVAKFTQDGKDLILESTYEAKAFVQSVTATGQVPVVPRPTFRNSKTTRWRVYRSPAKVFSTDPGFPAGFMIADLPRVAQSHSDTLTTSSTSFIFPTLYNSGADNYSDWINPSNLGADDAAVASATIAGTTDYLIQGKRQGCYGFNFSGITGSIRGIEVVVKGYVSAGTAPCPVNVTIGAQRDAATGLFVGQHIVGDLRTGRGVSNGGITSSKHGLISSVDSGAMTTLTLGGQNDRWFKSSEAGINDSDLNSHTVMAVVGHSSQNTTLALDYIKIKVYYSASFDPANVFPTIVYDYSDIASQVGKNGAPPSSSTGALYQDQLVVNDVSNPALIRWSFPGDPESFPATYFLDFETEENDRVRLIRVVNNRLVVALDGSIWRVNTLPSERDSSFERGEAIEPISRSFGCLGPKLACVYSQAGSSETLAFVSRHGIHTTDGYSFDTISDALDWRKVISIDKTDIAISCTQDGTTTLITAADFSRVHAGDAISGSGIAAGTTVVSVESTTSLTMSAVGTGGAAVLTFTIQITSTPIALINDPENHDLILYYRNDADPTDTYLAMHFNYSTEHLLPGERLKASGPVAMRNYDVATNTYAAVSAAWAVTRGTGESQVFLGFSGVASAIGAGQVWAETAHSLPAYDPGMSYTTRRMYLAGFGSEWELNGIYGYVSKQVGSPVISYTGLATKTGFAGEATQHSPELVMTGEIMHRAEMRQIGEGIKIRLDMIADHNDYAQEFLLIQGKNFGGEDAGT